LDPDGHYQQMLEALQDELVSLTSEYKETLSRVQKATSDPVVDQGELNSLLYSAINKIEKKNEQIQLLRQSYANISRSLHKFQRSKSPIGERRVQTLRMVNQIKELSRSGP